MITWTKPLILTASFLALITTNILTLTNTAFNAAVSGLMGTALGIHTVSNMMQTKLNHQDKTIRKQAAVQANRKAAVWSPPRTEILWRCLESEVFTIVTSGQLRRTGVAISEFKPTI